VVDGGGSTGGPRSRGAGDARTVPEFAPPLFRTVQGWLTGGVGYQKGVAMARAIWTGSLSFGLVNVPVALFTATESKSVHFNQFQAGTSDRVRNKRVNERTGDEVAYDEIVKGYDLGGGEYVVLSPDEIASVAPGKSRTIDVSAFVDLASIDPIYFDRPYYVAPPSKGAGKGGERAYALLLEAMTKSNKVAIATFVMRDKQYLVAIRPRDEALVLETLIYADEVRQPAKEIDTLPVETSFDRKELDMANLLIDSMSAEWQPELYRDTYRERLEELIEQKQAGGVVVVEPQEPEAAPVIDLLQALEASVEAARGSRGSGPPAEQAVAARSRPKRPAKESPAAKRPLAPNRPPKKSASGGGQLADLSRTELLRRATEMGIAGRSKMTRDELEAAVKGASRGRRPKAS
jgi:DNA end-binding protein Ku